MLLILAHSLIVSISSLLTEISYVDLLRAMTNSSGVFLLLASFFRREAVSGEFLRGDLITGEDVKMLSVFVNERLNDSWLSE
jgi:hypothetical protein